ncbi:MAG: hypothetical protein HKN18_05375 [Silicimonas sp.]|nr:hypothetical protein [Silicimonas sp.]
MVKFLLLQYRRLGFGTFFLFLSGLVLFSDGDKPIWLILTMAVAFALIMLVLAIIGIGIFPRYRTVYEMLGVIFLVVSAVDTAFPIVFDALGSSGQIIVFMIVFAAAEHFFYGAGQHKLPAPSRWSGRTEFITSSTPAEVWDRLVPNPDAPEKHYSGSLKEMTPDEGENTYRVMWRAGGSNFTVQDIEITENEPKRRFSYRFGGLVSEANVPMNSGNWDLELEETESGGTRITIVETIEKTRIGFALFLWFDNWAAQVGESAAAILAQRKDRSVFAIIRRYIVETT